MNTAAVTVSAHTYDYDGANRRVRADLADGSYWEYAYNDKGEVTSGVKKNAAGSVYPGLNHGYTFDEIGNRLTATVDAEGGGSRTTSYTANNLNQYTSIGTPSSFDVTGSAVSSAIVKVNTQNAQRQGTYFRKELPVSNSGIPVWAAVDIEVTLPGAGVGGGDIVTTRSGHRFIAPLPEAPVHDEDGNLVNDGRWLYAWDGENRLIAMETKAAAIAVGVPKRRLEFAYDGGSRRIRKQVYDWDIGTSSWTLSSERRFIYDQWNLMAEVDAAGNLLKSHVWGLDLSQMMQGAGGVGGLLWSADHTASHTHFVAYDGNGNVTALVDSTTATVDARYDYDAFGKMTVVEGDAVAAENPFRFSTKYEDVETGLYYYGFRYYSPNLGRWPSRDPIGERGGVNLYGFVLNSPLNRTDQLGLTSLLCKCCAAFWGGNTLTELNDRGLDHSSSASNASGGNAMRHCVAACQTAEGCGKQCAEDFWDGRENSSTKSGQQDLANNKIGYSLASGGPAVPSCFSKCYDAWSEGKLDCEGKPCPPPDKTYPENLHPANRELHGP